MHPHLSTPKRPLTGTVLQTRIPLGTDRDRNNDRLTVSFLQAPEAQATLSMPCPALAAPDEGFALQSSPYATVLCFLRSRNYNTSFWRDPRSPLPDYTLARRVNHSPNNSLWFLCELQAGGQLCCETLCLQSNTSL